MTAIPTIGIAPREAMGDTLVMTSDEPLKAALSTIPLEIDPYEAAKLQAMFVGYAEVWDAIEVDVLAVEREFALPLVDELGFVSSLWKLGGKIDAIVGFPATQRVAILEHKSSAEDVSVGSPYREKLQLAGQASQYFVGAESLGYAPDLLVWDVLVKPRIKPLEGNSRRKVKETPEEYLARILEGTTEDRYAQIEVTRTDKQRAVYARTCARDAQVIDFVRDNNLAAPNDDACFKYGATPCEFWGVCSGAASLDDKSLFRKLTNVHAELSHASALGVELLTNSRRQCFNACRRKHKFHYEQGYVSLKPAHALTFGTMIHRGLEAYWVTRGNIQAGKMVHRMSPEQVR